MTTTRGTLRLVERWLPVPGYGGAYEVSDRGAVRSLTRMVGDGRGRRLAAGRVMKPMLGRRAHLYVDLSNRVHRRFPVHGLVLLAFVGPRPEGLVTRHMDGDPANNRLRNLRYGTYSENAMDTIRHGTHPEASLTHCLRGHEFTPENTRVVESARGRARVCRECRRAYNRRVTEQSRAARAELVAAS